MTPSRLSQMTRAVDLASAAPDSAAVSATGGGARHRRVFSADSADLSEFDADAARSVAPPVRIPSRCCRHRLTSTQAAAMDGESVCACKSLRPQGLKNKQRCQHRRLKPRTLTRESCAAQQVPAIPESQPLAGNGITQLQSAASTGSNIGLQSASSGTMLRTGSTAAADQRAKNIEVPPRFGCHSPVLQHPEGLYRMGRGAAV